MSTAADLLASVPGQAIWGRIVSELARLQDAAPAESPGAVVNPVCGAVYVVDTSCAAAVFATEYQRTKDVRWKDRALAAVRAVEAYGIFRPIDEPEWGETGWHNVSGSLPATGIAVDAYFTALDRLELPRETDPVDTLLAFLSRCRTSDGGFAHNTLSDAQRRPDVQNATANALNLLGRLRSRAGSDDHTLFTGLDATVSRLRRGQTSSGFWPYRYPGARWKEAVDRRGLRTLLRPRRFFVYGAGGDLTHHLMTFFFAAQYCASAAVPTDPRMLEAGWRWIVQRLVRVADGSVSIDWSSDQSPTSPRFSNARDTNAYFLILGMLPALAVVGVIAPDESAAVAHGLMAHVDSRLMSSSPGHSTCVVPYEGPVEIVSNILPMFEQSVAWKGSLMANAIAS